MCWAIRLMEHRLFATTFQNAAEYTPCLQKRTIQIRGNVIGGLTKNGTLWNVSFKNSSGFEGWLPVMTSLTMPFWLLFFLLPSRFC